MNAKEISQALSKDAQSIVMMLLPNGKKESGRWVCGSVDGESGKSLKVELTGAKAGRWADYSAEGVHGDLLDLWRLTRNISAKEAFKEACEYLGIERPTLQNLKQYQRPEKGNIVKPVGKVIEYLQFRGLTAESIEKFKIRATPQDDAIVFPYFKNKELINLKTVKLDRDENGKKVEWQSKGAEPCLYGWHLIDENARKVVICEGELDAISLTQYEYPTLSVNQGAGNFQWVDSDYDELERFDTIYLCFDNDEAGKKAVKTAVERLGCDRTLICTLPYKDANECLQRGLNKADIDLCFKEAKSLDPNELVNAGSFVDDVIKEFYGDDESTAGYSMPWDKFQGKFSVRTNELSIVTGHNSHGKTMALCQIMLDLMRQGQRVCLFSGEMQPRRLLARFTRQAAATNEPSIPFIKAINQFFGESLWLVNVFGSIEWEKLIQVFTYAQKRYGINQFVIDSMMMCGMDTDDYNEQKKFVAALNNFKNRTDSHVWLVAHPNKKKSLEEIVDAYGVAGGNAIPALADNIISIWADKKGSRADEDPSHFISIKKQRNGSGWEGSAALYLDGKSLQFLSSQNAKARPYVDWSIKDNIEI